MRFLVVLWLGGEQDDVPTRTKVWSEMNRFLSSLRNPLRNLGMQAGGLVALVAVVLWAPNASAYPMYDDGVTTIGMGAGCIDCHNGFVGGSGGLHQNHRFQLDVQTCNLCHPSGGGSTPISTYTSGSGGGFGCAGCHGRDYGETSVIGGQPKATGYGLRQVHAANGVTECATCHMPGALGSPNPFPAILGENVPPPYYAPIFSNLTDPCASGQEDMPFDVDSIGLDNDGDGDVDFPADSDCAPAASPTPTATPVPFECGVAPIPGCVAPEKAVLLVNEKNAGKEKLKVVLKKLQSAVTQGDFGDPVGGTTAQKICLYDSADQLVGEYNVSRAGDTCGDKPCWAEVSTKGYKFKDKTTTDDGILKMKTLGGDTGKGKILVVGKNTSSTMPTGAAAALENEASATVQFLTDDASCFGANLTTVKKADGAIFKALAP